MKKNEQGFTLTEVMLASVISTVVLFGTFGMLQASNRQLQVAHAKMTIQEGPREALFKMAQEIRQTAWHKIVDFEEISGDISQSNTITFIVPVPNPNPTDLVDANYTPKWANAVQYRLDETTHQILRVSTDLTTNAVKEAILANEITSLVFSKSISNPGLITITLETQRELPDGEKIPVTPIQMTIQAEARNP